MADSVRGKEEPGFHSNGGAAFSVGQPLEPSVVGLLQLHLSLVYSSWLRPGLH